MNQKRAILGALLGVFTICLIYAYLATPRLEKAPPRVASPRKQPVNQKSSAGDQRESPGRIDFAYLSSSPQEFTGAQRDIFQFGQRRPVKSATTTRVVKKEVSKPVLRPEVVPVEVVQKSLSQFTFLGFLEKAGAKTVFLSSGGNLFLVKQGEHFGVGQEFLVEQIDDKHLKVRHAGREELIEIQLIEKQKLYAAVSAPVSISRDAGLVRRALNTRVTRPSRRIARPDAQQEDMGSQGDQVLMEEYNPDAVQDQESTGNEDATEGEINGKNQ
jgi:hypothetical protein